jgi:hypothetical protein
MSHRVADILEIPSIDDFRSPFRGFVLIAPPLRLLYMNVDAREVIARYNRCLEEKSDAVLRGEILTFCLELLEMLRCSQQQQRFDLCELHRRIKVQTYFLLLRGLAVPKPDGLLQSRMCVLFNEIKPAPTLAGQPYHAGSEPCLTDGLSRNNSSWKLCNTPMC